MLNQELSTELERMYGPVDARFRITQTPEGSAPLDIREQWKDVTLPVRRLHAVRLMHGYIGKRFLRAPEDSSYLDAISGEPIKTNTDWPIGVEVRGWDAINSLEEAGRDEAAKFWVPYGMALLSFRLYEGTFKKVE